MYNTHHLSTQTINLNHYRDQVLGCWSGKNVGGTLGAPFEGQREMNQVRFYTEKLNGLPAPNDDLDLQLIWLTAIEEQGVWRLTERLLGEYWLNHIAGPWNEYGVCKSNMRCGLYPPLSGSVNNERWKRSNGAWIRSELWACLFPGSPDEAACFAAMDACCDHADEGIYAEVFTAALESAAFVVGDLRRLLAIGLAKIPADCRIARNVQLAAELYDGKTDFAAARNAIVNANEDLGWFQAPANLGFVTLALLYGEGDFGRSVALAVNCGDDTDCTAGTVGAILGIILGRSNIPREWMKPIGESIQTCSISTYNCSGCLSTPRTLAELTRRVTRAALDARRENPTLPQLAERETVLTADYLEKLADSSIARERIWNRSPYELTHDLFFAKFAVDYQNGPEMVEGETKKLILKMFDVPGSETTALLRFTLPEGWRMTPSESVVLAVKSPEIMRVEVELTAGAMKEAFTYLPVDIRLAGRFHPTTVQLPIQRRGCVGFTTPHRGDGFYDALNRRKSRCLAAAEIS